MKLHWSPRSPFVRKVMICVHELGFTGLQLVRTPVEIDHPNRALLTENPIGKIPALVFDDGVVLYDSAVICEYLDTTYGRGQLFPIDSASKWTALRRQALGDGVLDALLWWRFERAKPAQLQNSALMFTFESKTNACLDALEAESAALSADAFTIGTIAIGCALCYFDFRFADRNWREGRAGLEHWHREFKARPSVAITDFVDDR